MAMEMAMMGLLGTVVGASAMGIGGIAKSIAEAYVPGVAAAKDRRQQMNVDLQARRYEAVRVWRSGLCSASNAYRQWEDGSRDTHAPNVVGDEWFEGLRPHLPTTGEAAKFRTAYEVRCDNPTLMVLSLEIGRIEKEWMVEASGRTPKHRG